MGQPNILELSVDKGTGAGAGWGKQGEGGGEGGESHTYCTDSDIYACCIF